MLMMRLNKRRFTLAKEIRRKEREAFLLFFLTRKDDEGRCWLKGNKLVQMIILYSPFDLK